MSTLIEPAYLLTQPGVLLCRFRELRSQFLGQIGILKVGFHFSTVARPLAVAMLRQVQTLCTRVSNKQITKLTLIMCLDRFH